ncbi:MULTISPECIES: hypothetical protein [Bradyrhizobium]|uniref:Uncharacterized protein n=1 Tax=Bradyrhizobium brasilense TaxID=1419277 RepID=A0ABY8J9U1_9BRAD|nr:MULTISPECIES: hypothetical protein [Bradyrhizobium]MCP1907907.1 hypothetical protein [Bradyrhizobium elkanii]MCP1834042.1 hypothetical protein [Bradyrhizobium sp. USDA 4545]MCP1853072.1 hypothetical protein [Bradyrhizobium sp. USDA 4541]MCP1918788.1 hypothetical protein [Bradyrhizobium sp. USDA 4532]NLS71632.1 hypothetical protein [Bradyrhizobium brasilense]
MRATHYAESDARVLFSRLWPSCRSESIGAQSVLSANGLSVSGEQADEYANSDNPVVSSDDRALLAWFNLAETPSC